MKDKFGVEVVPCKWCGTQTPITDTKLCDRCWELDGRIRHNLELAKRIVAFYSNEEQSQIDERCQKESKAL